MSHRLYIWFEQLLQELHEYNDGFAHLDIRIPNICFSRELNLDGEYDVKLVDLNRFKSVSAIVTGRLYWRDVATIDHNTIGPQIN